MSAILEFIAGALVLVGAGFVLVSGIGLMRLPDLYTRTHAVSVSDSFGAVLILLGLAFYATDPFGVIKLLTIAVFLLLTGPAAAQALVKAAYSRGVAAEIEAGNGAGRPDDPA